MNVGIQVTSSKHDKLSTDTCSQERERVRVFPKGKSLYEAAGVSPAPKTSALRWVSWASSLSIAELQEQVSYFTGSHF